MIKKISFRLLRVDEYHTLGSRIDEVVSNMVKEDAQLLSLSSNLQRNLKLLADAHLKPSTKSLTLSVEEADHNRDNGFRAFRSYLEACSRRLNPEWKEAADLLLNIVHQHGYTLYKDGYDKQSSRMNNMIHEMKFKREFRAPIEKIEAFPWLDEMDQANQEFEKVFSHRNEVNTGTPEVKTEEACKEVRRDIELLFKYIDVMISLDINPKYASLANKINGYISQMMSQLRSRKTRTDNQKQVEEVETTEK